MKLSVYDRQKESQLRFAKYNTYNCDCCGTSPSNVHL